MSTMIREKEVITRKPHKCFGCGRNFNKGSKMLLSVAKEGNKLYNIYLCPTCKELITDCELGEDISEGEMYEEAVIHECAPKIDSLIQIFNRSNIIDFGDSLPTEITTPFYELRSIPLYQYDLFLGFSSRLNRKGVINLLYILAQIPFNETFMCERKFVGKLIDNEDGDIQEYAINTAEIWYTPEQTRERESLYQVFFVTELSYKGFYTKIYYSPYCDSFTGRIENAIEYPEFKTKTVYRIAPMFHGLVEDYIELCRLCAISLVED